MPGPRCVMPGSDRASPFAALTSNRHSVHSACQRGKHFRGFAHFPCRVDAKSPFYAFCLSTWHCLIVYVSVFASCPASTGHLLFLPWRGNGSHFLGPFREPGKWLSVAGAPGCACLRCLCAITFWPARRVYRAGLTLILYVVPITIPWRRCVTYLAPVSHFFSHLLQTPAIRHARLDRASPILRGAN